MSTSTDLFTLSKAFLKAGYAATSTVENAMQVMDIVDVRNEDAIARVLAVMVRTHSDLEPSADGQRTWQVDNFVEAIRQQDPSINWTTVLCKLDHPEFTLYNLTGLKMIVDTWNASQKHNPTPEEFPLQVFFLQWQNVRGQLSVLYQMLCSPPDLFDLANHPGITSVIRPVHIMALNTAMRPAAMQLAAFQLNCLEMISAIISLADTSVGDDVRFLMERLTVQYPELLLLGLAQLQPIKNDLQRTLLLKLLNIFLIGHANSALVITLLMRVQPNLMVEGLLDMYAKDPTTLPRILDVAQETKILVHILRVDAPMFVLDLASLAARRQHLNMEKWLSERVATADGLAFSIMCIDFLEKKCSEEVAKYSRPNANVPTLPLSIDVLRIFFRVLGERQLPAQESEKLWKIMQLYSQLHAGATEHTTSPSMARVSTPGMAPDTNGLDQNQSAAEIELMVKRYFVRLYSGELSAEKFVAVLHNCHDSQDQNQSEFFSCTVHTLLDEVRFFNQYPDDELRVTGKLFGLLIHHHLITYTLLRLALKHILDAVNSPVGSKMFQFGVFALAQFLDRLSEWPQYTMLLSKIPGLKEYPSIVESIDAAINRLSNTVNDNDERLLHTASSTPRGANASSPAPSDDDRANATSAQLTKLLEASNSYDIPPEDVQEKIAFAINNLTLSNMDDKLQQIEPLLDETRWKWFSHYLIVRRVSVEKNNHDLYSTLLTRIDNSGLTDAMIEETYRNIQILLHSKSTDASQRDRDTLKTLGSWLGKMTLVKNKPIRHKDLSFKDLLLECYDQKRLIVAIPLTCRVLQEACNSKIFKPPNPWLMGILKLLAELYWQENLSLKLKFEIEILYKALDLDLNEIEPTSLLERRQRTMASTSAAAAAVTASTPQSQLPAQATAALDNMSQSLQQQQQQDQHLKRPNLPDRFTDIEEEDTMRWPSGNEHAFDVDVSALLSKLQFSQAILQAFDQSPVMKMCVFRAMTEAIHKVVPSAVMTAANIASASTRNLVLKDFATDADEMKLKRAAHTMSSTLSARLAVATCKEPLCNTIIETIRMQVAQANLPETIGEEIGSSIILDNIDLIEAFVEKQAQLRSINDIERIMAPSYASRRMHKENPHSPYFDMLSLQGSPHNIQLPDFLKPTGNVSYEQMQFYETFDHLPTPPIEAQMPPNSMPPPSSYPYGVYPNVSAAPGLPAPAAPEQINDSSAVVSKIQSMLNDLDHYIRQPSNNDIGSFKALPPQHEIYQYMRQFLVFIKSNPMAPNALQTFAEKVMLMLYQSSTAFALETYTAFLQAIFELYPELAKEAVSWFLYADDERKYNADVTYMLISYELIPLEEHDVQLSKLIRAKADGILDYAVSLMRLCLLSKSDVSVLEDHVLTVAALQDLVKSAEAPESVMAFINEIEDEYKAMLSHTVTVEGSYLEMRMLLAQWTRLCIHPMCKDSLLNKLATKIIKDVCKSDDQQHIFLRMCIQTAVQQYLSFSSPTSPNQYRIKDSTDSVARLFAFMTIAREPDNSKDDNRSKFLYDALSVIVLMLASHHQAQENNFDQRPFLRLLLSTFIEVSKATVDINAIVPFSEVLYTIRPSLLPGFAFSWLQIISHRVILSELLAGHDAERWKLCEKLIVALLEFLGELIQQGGLALQSSQIFYRGTLRTLVVILHDFPEFLSHHYMSLVSVIPHDCVQIRNLVLSAFPPSMRLPDPSVPDMSLDNLAEFNETPAMSLSYTASLRSGDDDDDDDVDIMALADEYMSDDTETETQPSFFTKALEYIQQSTEGNEDESHQYHSHRLGALVLYIGSKGAALTATMALENNPATRLYSYLLEHMTAEGRYILLSAMTDHLRYPNSHTYFFRAVLLLLFTQKAESIKENITRVLLERLIVNRPHPWGLLATFIELLSVPGFWQHKFIHAAPEFQRLFDNVSRYVKRQS